MPSPTQLTKAHPGKEERAAVRHIPMAGLTPSMGRDGEEKSIQRRGTPTLRPGCNASLNSNCLEYKDPDISQNDMAPP